MWPKHAHHKIMYVFLTVWLQKIEPGKCFNYYTSIAQFYITYHFAANSRSTSETQRDYSNRRIWETSIMSSLCTSVSIHTLFSCNNSENFTVFQDIHIVQQILATRLGVSCLGCVLPWRRRVLISYSPGNIKTFWRYFDQNGFHSYSPVFNEATRRPTFRRILYIYCCHSDAK